MSATELKGEALVLDLANRARGCGGVAPARLYHECVQAFRRGEVSFDVVTPLFRHAMVHAGMTVRKGGRPFYECPSCGARLEEAVDG